MRLILAFILSFVSLLMRPDAGLAQDYVALLIGNSNYRHEPALDNPHNDVRQMERTLAALGYEVDVSYDLSKTGIERALQRFSRKADRAQNAVIFYSGHGMAIRDVNYVIPVDASLQREADARYEAVELKLFSEAVSGASNLQIIIFDACRDNNFLGRKGGRQGYQSMPPVKSQIIAFSTALGAPAYDGRGALSPYTQALSEKLLAEPDKDVRLLFSELGPRVAELIGEEQTPWVSSASFRQGHYPIGRVTYAEPVTAEPEPTVVEIPAANTPAYSTPVPVEPVQPAPLPAPAPSDSRAANRFFAICGKGSGPGEYDTAFSAVSLADAFASASSGWATCPYLQTASFGQCMAIARAPRGAWRWSTRGTEALAREAALSRCGPSCSLIETHCTSAANTPGLHVPEDAFASPRSAPLGRHVALCIMGPRKGEYSAVFDDSSMDSAKAKLQQVWPSCPSENVSWASSGNCIAVAGASGGAWASRRRNTEGGAYQAAIEGCEGHGGKDCQVTEMLCTGS